MKKILFIIMITSGFAGYSQVGVGTTSPDSSAQLDVVSANKGILIPRVLLNGSSDVATIANPKESLLVYNTQTISDVVPGFYYWNKVKWVALASGGGGLSGTVGIVNGGTGATTVSGALTNLGAQSVSNLTTVLGSTADHYPSENAVRLYVDNETLRAKVAETDLQSKVDTKAALTDVTAALATKAEAADLTTEVTRATNAETVLSTSLSAKAEAADLTTEVNRATNAETALGTSLSAKASTAYVDNSVNNEVTRATNAETALSASLSVKAEAADLTTEVTRATNAETALSTSLSAKAEAADLTTEVNRATNAETALSASLIAKAEAADLTTEVTRATNAETALGTSLSAKASTAYVDNSVNNEVTRATNAETALSASLIAKAEAADLTTEVTRATNAETALSASLGAKAAAADLTTEVTRATNAETALSTSLSAKAAAADLTTEVTRATNAEAALSTSLSAKEILTNKSNVIDTQTDDTKYPSVKAVKTYVDANPSFYGADGTLSGARTVNQNNNDLKFTTGSNGSIVMDGNLRKNGAVFSNFVVTNSSGYTVPLNVNTIVYNGFANAIFTLPPSNLYAGMEIKIWNVSGFDVQFPAGTFYANVSNKTVFSGTGAIVFSDGTQWYLLLGAL